MTHMQNWDMQCHCLASGSQLRCGIVKSKTDTINWQNMKKLLKQDMALIHIALEVYYQLKEKKAQPPPKNPKRQHSRQTQRASECCHNIWWSYTLPRNWIFLPQCLKPLLLFPTFAVTDCTFNIVMNMGSLRRQEQQTSGIRSLK